MSAPPIWIRTPGEAQALARDLEGAPAIAVDTEADSLHHYPERLCLIQLADPEGRVYFVDALVLLGDHSGGDTLAFAPQPLIEIASSDFGPFPAPEGLKNALTAMITEAYTGSLGPVATGLRIETISIANGVMTITGRVR